MFVLGKVFLYLDNRSRMMSSGVLLLLTLTTFLLANYPLKQWWRVSLLDLLPDSKIPEGVFEIDDMELAAAANVIKEEEGGS